MSLKDTARHHAAGQIGRDHPYLVLLVGPLLPFIGVAILAALVIWGLVKLVGAATDRVSMPGLPSFSVPDIPVGSGLLVTILVVVGLALLARKAWRWSNGY